MPAQILEISSNNKAINYPEYTEAKNFYRKKQADKVEEWLTVVLQKLKDGGHTEDYIELLFHRGKNLLNLFRTDDAMEVFIELRNLSKINNLPNMEAEAIQALNVIYTFKNDNAARVLILNSAVKIKGLSDENYSDACSSLASSLKARSKLDSALFLSLIHI